METATANVVRAQSRSAVASDLTMAFDSIQDGGAFAVMPPPVFGYGNAAGVDAFVQDRGRIGYGELNN